MVEQVQACCTPAGQQLFCLRCGRRQELAFVHIAAEGKPVVGSAKRPRRWPSGCVMRRNRARCECVWRSSTVSVWCVVACVVVRFVLHFVFCRFGTGVVGVRWCRCRIGADRCKSGVVDSRRIGASVRPKVRCHGAKSLSMLQCAAMAHRFTGSVGF